MSWELIYIKFIKNNRVCTYEMRAYVLLLRIYLTAG